MPRPELHVPTRAMDGILQTARRTLRVPSVEGAEEFLEDSLVREVLPVVLGELDVAIGVINHARERPELTAGLPHIRRISELQRHSPPFMRLPNMLGCDEPGSIWKHHRYSDALTFLLHWAPGQQNDAPNPQPAFAIDPSYTARQRLTGATLQVVSTMVGYDTLSTHQHTGMARDVEVHTPSLALGALLEAPTIEPLLANAEYHTTAEVLGWCATNVTHLSAIRREAS